MAERGINKVIIVGNLGQAPELRYMPNGGAVASLTLATSESWRDKATGEQREKTEWHRVVVFGKLAEIAGEYLKKGGKVYVEGRLQTRSWDDKQSGQKKYMTEVVASDLVLLGGRGEGGGEYSGSSRGASASAGGNNFDQTSHEPEPAPAGSAAITDEDIPF